MLVLQARKLLALAKTKATANDVTFLGEVERLLQGQGDEKELGQGWDKTALRLKKIATSGTSQSPRVPTQKSGPPPTQQKDVQQIRGHKRGNGNISPQAAEALHRLDPQDRAKIIGLGKLSAKAGNAVIQALVDIDKLAVDPNGKDQAERARLLLLRDLRGGPLSLPNQSQKFKDAAPGLIALYLKHPELASDALDLAQNAKHPDILARGVEVVGPLLTTSLDEPKGSGRRNAGNALKLGGQLGGDYFERMDNYYKTGRGAARFDLPRVIDEEATAIAKQQKLELIKKFPNMEEHAKASIREQANKIVEYKPQSDSAKANRIATGLAKSLIDDKGELQLGGTFGEIRDDMHFHPSMLSSPYVSLIESVEEMRATLSDPKASLPYKKILAETKAPARGAATHLVGQALGLPKTSTLTQVDGQRALMSGMLMPLYQGDVGSCFATAPALKQRRTDPLSVMKDMSDIIGTGTLSKQDGKKRVKMPAITRITEGENPLLRSWEYTVAALGSRREGSQKRRELIGSLFGSFGKNEQKGDSLHGLVDGNEGELVESVLAERFTFTFDPTTKHSEKGGDGVSDKGAWILQYREESKTQTGVFKDVSIDSWENFMPKLQEVLNKTLPKKSQAIAKLLQSPAFKLAVGSMFTPWTPKAGGGLPTEVIPLFTNQPVKNSAINLLDETNTDKRPTILLTHLTENIVGKSNSPFSTVGGPSHAMNVLPEQLNTLKGKDKKETEQKIRAKLEQPGETLAKTELSLERTGFLFDKFVDKLGTRVKVKENDRPKTKQTPKQFKQHLMSCLNNSIKGEEIDSFLLNQLRPPEIVAIDTNWGSPLDHTYYVMAPAPDTGILTMWKKQAFTGEYTKEVNMLSGGWQVYH